MKLFPAKFNLLLLRTFIFYLSLSLILLLLPSRWTEPVRAVFLYPASFVFRGSLQAARKMESSVRTLRTCWAENRELSNLHKQYVALQAELVLETEKRKTAESRLIQFESIPENLRTNSIAARVVWYDPSTSRRVAVLDKGSRAGVQPGRPVFWNGVVAGRVESVAPWTSRVALVSDPNCRIAVRDESSRVEGEAEGLGGNLCRIKYVPREATVAEGDRFVTSGIDGVFPAGYLVGLCRRASNDSGDIYMDVEITPALQVVLLEHAAILLSDQRKEEETP